MLSDLIPYGQFFRRELPLGEAIISQEVSMRHNASLIPLFKEGCLLSTYWTRLSKYSQIIMVYFFEEKWIIMYFIYQLAYYDFPLLLSYVITPYFQGCNYSNE